MRELRRTPSLRSSQNSPSTHSGEYANRGRRTIPGILYAREASAYPRLSAAGFAQAGLGRFFDGPNPSAHSGDRDQRATERAARMAATVSYGASKGTKSPAPGTYRKSKLGKVCSIPSAQDVGFTGSSSPTSPRWVSV